MEEKNYVCGGTTFAFMQGYIVLPVAVGELPESVPAGEFTLQKKSEFHVSLLCVKAILVEHPALEEEILNFFCEYTKEHPISFVRYTGEFRYAEDGEKKTIVALCEVANLTHFSEALSAKLGFVVPPQPTHVTLYTLPPHGPIGLPSPADMERKTTSTDVTPDVKRGLGLTT